MITHTQINTDLKHGLTQISFWMILAIGVGLRLYHAWTAPFAYANSDTATLWLMARHILHGEFPLFFYGQYYLGPLEALIIAFFFMLFGIKISTLYLGTIFYSVLFMVSGYFLGKELKDRALGVLIMLYSALPPPYFFRESIAPLGYHIEILFLGNIIFILTLKIPQLLQGKRKTVYYVLLGLFSGTGVWAHYVILYYLVPSAVYIIINEKWKDILKNVILAAISFFIIALPFWVFTFKYNFATFRFKSASSPPVAIINFFKLLAQHLNYMFNVDFNFKSLAGFILIIYIIFILYFMFSSLFNKKNSILAYFFIFILVFYVGFRTKMYAGEGYNYILPILTFMSAVFGYFCRRFRVLGVCAAVLVISFNTKSIFQDMSEQKNTSDSYKQIIYDKIRFLEENNIFRFIGHEGYSRVPVFFSNERIIATGFMECRYPPHEDIVEASDRIAFEESGNDWHPVLDNICKGYSSKMGIFYNFIPLSYRTRMIKPIAYGDMKYGCDRNYDTFWVSKNGRGFTVDLGRRYTICKIELFNGHRYNSYPASCKIQTSVSGYTWVDAVDIGSIQTLFWSGPRLYWHPMDGRAQWFFKPREARFIRLIQGRGSFQTIWEINEIFVYEYLGDEVLKVKDYVKDAKDIIRFLISKGINFTYADFWLSAKIRSISKGKVEALVPYNSYLPPRENMSREVQLGRDRAFIVKTGDTEEIEDILNEFRMPFRKINFRYYTCYYFPQLEKGYESIRSLLWVGIGMIRHSLKDYSEWLYNQGDYGRALRYYPNNFMAYLKCKGLPATRFFPKVPKTIDFINGPRFLGYSVRAKKLIPGRIIRMEYFWEVRDEIKGDISMFVHFVKDNKIIFQNDHRFLYQYPRPLRPLPGERFREVLKLVIPKDIGPGSYQIIIGLWDERKKERIHMIEPSGKKTSKKIIGELVINET